MEFRDRLKEIRKAKGLTRKELGEAANISHRTLEKYEQGSRSPRVEMVIKLSEALDVHPCILCPELITKGNLNQLKLLISGLQKIIEKIEDEHID